MNDMLSFIYLASLFAVGGAAFSLMWKNLTDIKNQQVRRYSARPHPEAQKKEKRFYTSAQKWWNHHQICTSRYENAWMKSRKKMMMEIL